jgi:hypothetical protein
MFDPGTIIYFKPFYFKNGNSPANKFFLILHCVENDFVLASLPTSQDHIPNFADNKSGCIEIPEAQFNCFLFNPGDVITDLGFSFDEKTVLYGHLIDLYTIDFFAQYPHEDIDYFIKGKLQPEIFQNMIDCFRHSVSVKRKYKRLLLN